MAEKTNPDIGYYDDKENSDVPRRMSLAEATARKQSVALNIVINPLKVRLFFPTHAPRDLILRMWALTALSSNSASLLERTSKMLERIAKRMGCPSTPICSVEPL